MDKKTLTFIGLILLIAFIAGGLIWFFIFRTPKQVTPQPQEVENDIGNDFFPINGTSSNQLNVSNTPDNGADVPIPKIRRITEEPTPGYVIFEREVLVPIEVFGTTTLNQFSTSTETVFRFAERATGHIYETTSKSYSLRKVSNKTIPKIYDAKFNKNGSEVIYSYLNALNTPVYYSAKIVGYSSTSTNSVGSLVGSFLPEGITSLDVSPEGNKIVFTRISNDGYTKISTSNFDGSGLKEISSLPTSTWTVSWPTSNNIVVQSKTSNKENGYIYSVSPTTGLTSKVLGDKKGLLGLMSPDLKSLLFSETTTRNPEMRIFQTETQGEKYINYFGLPEKCVWKRKTTDSFICAIPKSLTENLPETWYQGAFSFNDNFILFNYLGSSVDPLTNEGDFGDLGVDGINLSLSSDDKHLMFINKKDLSLWSIRLED